MKDNSLEFIKSKAESEVIEPVKRALNKFLTDHDTSKILKLYFPFAKSVLKSWASLNFASNFKFKMQNSWRYCLVTWELCWFLWADFCYYAQEKYSQSLLCGSHQPGVRGSEMAVTGQRVEFCEASSSVYFFHSLCVAEKKHTVSRFNLTLSGAYCVICSKANGGEDTGHWVTFSCY